VLRDGSQRRPAGGLAAVLRLVVRGVWRQGAGGAEASSTATHRVDQVEQEDREACLSILDVY
jgi:hypothetical protein